MKLPAILLALLLTSIISSGAPTPKLVRVITADKIENRDGIGYEVGQTTPFTGLLQHMYPNGKKQAEVNWKDGKFHGLETLWHRIQGTDNMSSSILAARLVELRHFLC